MKKKNFFAPLYAGAEQQDDPDDMWVALLSSDLVFAMATLRIAEAVVLKLLAFHSLPAFRG